MRPRDCPRRRVDVGDNDLSARLGQRQSAGAADAGGRAGDERDLAVECHATFAGFTPCVANHASMRFHPSSASALR